MMFLVVNIFVFLKSFFSLGVALYDLVHDVEAVFHL